MVRRLLLSVQVPPTRNTIFLDVLPSGMVITPVERNGEIHSHIALVAHFDLKGTISSQVFGISSQV